MVGEGRDESKEDHNKWFIIKSIMLFSNLYWILCGNSVHTTSALHKNYFPPFIYGRLPYLLCGDVIMWFYL